MAGLRRVPVSFSMAVVRPKPARTMISGVRRRARLRLPSPARSGASSEDERSFAATSRGRRLLDVAGSRGRCLTVDIRPCSPLAFMQSPIRRLIAARRSSCCRRGRRACRRRRPDAAPMRAPWPEPLPRWRSPPRAPRKKPPSAPDARVLKAFRYCRLMNVLSDHPQTSGGGPPNAGALGIRRVPLPTRAARRSARPGPPSRAPGPGWSAGPLASAAWRPAGSPWSTRRRRGGELASLVRFDWRRRSPHDDTTAATHRADRQSSSTSGVCPRPWRD